MMRDKVRNEQLEWRRETSAWTSERETAVRCCLHRSAETDAVSSPRNSGGGKRKRGEGKRQMEEARAKAARKRWAWERSVGEVRRRRRACKEAAVVFLSWLGEIRMRRTNGLTKVPKVGDTGGYSVWRPRATRAHAPSRPAVQPAIHDAVLFFFVPVSSRAFPRVSSHSSSLFVSFCWTFVTRKSSKSRAT